MNLLFDFTVDRATSTIHITREFAAEVDLVWDAFTKPEILDQWTAPKPWRAATKEMDFREGGRSVSAMISPENVSFWSLTEFLQINPKTIFISKNSFCDENGIAKPGSSLTKTSFRAGAETTTVHIEKQMGSLDVLEKFIAMGYKEGMTSALGNLDEYFLTVVTS
jgi:PhnB protein